MNLNPKGYHHGDLRKQLLCTAERIVVERGLEAVTLRRLSRHIGVSHTAAYRHFRNKDELIRALAEEGFKLLLQKFREIDGNEHYTPPELIKALGKSYIDFAFENPARYHIMFGNIIANASLSTIQQAAGKPFMHLFNAIRLGQIEGIIRSEDPLELSSITWSLIHGLAGRLIDNRLMGWQEQHAADLRNQDAGRLIDLGLDHIVSGLLSSIAED